MNARALVAILLVLPFGCHKDEPEVAPLVSVDAGKPLDHLAPGELPEGKERAFALMLPLGMTVERRLFDLVLARGQLPYPTVVDYVVKRAQGGALRKEENRVFLRGVRLAGEPDRALDIIVERKVDHVRIEVHDVTPGPPPPPLPNDEARWKAAGLKPNGEPLDPTKLR